MSTPPKPIRLPELMAPAGDWQCARAAVENGADAVYFGLQNGLNARARAANFSLAELPELMAFLRTRGVKGYLTLNTLVFADELAEAEQIARATITAGIDAVLVQDLGLLRLLHRLCPELPLHASTQMTLSSAECIREVESLGVRRVVLPRELTINQIAAIRTQTDVELEAFVHGALCISYSGQCLASLSMGGRSANRGQCAQPCRLPYELICDSEPPLTHPSYLLSPHDLAAYDRLAELIAAGVSALKIEGRLKPAEYVASVTRHYRAALDAMSDSPLSLSERANDSPLSLWEKAADGPLSLWERVRVRAACKGTPDISRCAASPHPRPLSQRERGDGCSPDSIADMELTFSRGFCHGWLDGPDHRALVSGEGSAKRGVLLGSVQGVRGERIRVDLTGPLRRGDGVVFAGDRSQTAEQGGRVYEIFRNGRPVDEASAGAVELAFRYGSIALATIRIGQEVWKTDDPRAARRLRESYSSAYAQRRVPVDLTVEASVGSPLRMTAVTTTGITCRLESPQPLPEAKKHPLTIDTLREQFGRLGKTAYELRHLDVELDGRAMIPLSELGKLRHEMVRQLDAAATKPPQRRMIDESALITLRGEIEGESGESSRVACEAASGYHHATAPLQSPNPEIPKSPNPQIPKSPNPQIPKSPSLHVLCRSLNQLEAALDCGVSSVIAELREPADHGDAVQAAHRRGASILLAAPRIHKPGESGVFEQLAAQRPDGLLVRNLAGLAFCRSQGLPAVADFSLNAVNELTIDWLHAQGADRATAAYDLSPERLLDLAATVPSEWLEVVMHRHTPMFHSEYCLFCARLSSGSGPADCGRPCQHHSVRLRDRLGVEHYLLSDSQCRNTLFHAQAENLLEILPGLKRRGVRHFRVELLAESGQEVRRTLATYRRACDQP
jgi:U32 family peptidase